MSIDEQIEAVGAIAADVIKEARRRLDEGKTLSPETIRSLKDVLAMLHAIKTEERRVAHDARLGDMSDAELAAALSDKRLP